MGTDGEAGAAQAWADALAFDRAHLWHPYASMIDPVPACPVVSAEGVRLKLADGRELIDGMASWWTPIHGYNHPRLNRAAADQLRHAARLPVARRDLPASSTLRVSCGPPSGKRRQQSWRAHGREGTTPHST